MVQYFFIRATTVAASAGGRFGVFLLTKDYATIDIMHEVIEFVRLVWEALVIVKHVAQFQTTLWLGGNMDRKMNSLNSHLQALDTLARPKQKQKLIKYWRSDVVL
jgi:hypothetical protein